jgi:hypothetical protein
MASLVGRGGGLCDRSVKESDGPSRVAARVGVKERVWRSLSRSSLCSRAEEGRISSVWCRPVDAMPAQSPESGLTEVASGDADRGVKLPRDKALDHLGHS